jgi:DNA-binding response OmpR family regulator
MAISLNYESMKKIMVIDDDPGILEAIKAILESENYAVLATDRMDQVMELKNGELPDLILLDLLLSGKDGREIAKALRGSEKTKNIPIVMLSAHPSAEDASKEGGADEFLAKPFDMDELLKVVKKYTSK